MGMGKKRILRKGKLRCPKCKSYKEPSKFYPHKHAAFNRASYCIKCSKENRKFHHHIQMKDNPLYREKQREANINRKYNMTPQEYENKLETQNYLCAICQVKLLLQGHGTHLDHDHNTGKLRAFLCTYCNSGLGFFRDSVVRLTQAIEYLTFYEKVH